MKLVYDVNSMPKGLGMNNMVKILENHRVVFWDSTTGVKPKFYSGINAEDEAKILVVDTLGEEVDLAHYQKQHEEKEFWERELYNCKNSPTHFFTNYGTTKWPATSADIRTFLEGLGLGEISVDSEDAEKAWKTQKEKLKVGLADITIELLQERAAVVAVLKSEYETNVNKLEIKLGEFVRLKDSNNVPLDDKKQISNLVEKIRRILPVNEAYSSSYRTKKGKWDTPMLYNTSYDVLLKIFDEVRQVNP